MAKLVVRPIDNGLRTDRLAFNIDNDSFPFLVNAYQWRGRVKRKRGTSLLGRLTRYFNSSSLAYSSISTITLSSGKANLLTGFNLQTNGNIVPGSVSITDTTTSTTYTDNGTGLLIGGSGGTINYATGVITITGGGSDTISAIFLYFPDLPVEGLEDWVNSASAFPGTIAFDTTYSYNIVSSSPYSIYDVSFYKNPISASINGHTYTAKSVVTPTSWKGQDYQQFWTTNYQGALWATNGVNVPFTAANIGMQFAQSSNSGASNFISSVTWSSSTLIVFVITNCSLVQGDWVFANEFTSTTPANANFLNWQTGYVESISGMAASLTVNVRFPYANIPMDTYTPGILQYLTNRSDVTKDCLRWYDGDPTNGNATNPTLNGHLGWVNFMPPLSRGTWSLEDEPASIYYLVGAKAIVAFKGRLLFFGAVIQTSTSNPMYLQDVVVFSQAGTPYYTSSSSTDISLSTTVFNALLVPENQTATANAYFEDQTGFGGNIPVGIDQPINTVINNEDVLIVGLTNRQTRLVFTGDDLLPFNFFSINSEFGSSATFSAITLDRGALTIGPNGIVLTSQVSSQRIDLPIPDQIYQFNLTNNGTQRICAQRDFINEWIYFTYPDNESPWKYPNQTLQYNYRDNSWAIFNECYTTYGLFKRQTGYTWTTLPSSLTWSSWTTPWNAGDSTLLQTEVIAGNQQGFVIFRDNEGTGESVSLEITNIQGPITITGATQANPCVLTANNSLIVGQLLLVEDVEGMTQLNGNYYTISAVSPTTVTINVNAIAFTAYVSGGIGIASVYSPNHCLSNLSSAFSNFGDYIVPMGCLGTIGPLINGKIFSIFNPTNDPNNFFLNPQLTSTGTYVGGGTIQRMYVPYFQTKQFPVAWDMARKTRIGNQQYLLSTTNNGQITLYLFLSQNDVSPYNFGSIVPTNDPEPLNNSLIYSTIVYTCPESTNLGLTPANINLQMVTSNQQNQIWHRLNTSLIGDTVQLGFTLSDDQMRDTTFSNQFAEIELHGFIIEVQPSQLLA